MIIGDVEGGGIAQIISRIIKDKFENKYNLRVSIYFYGEDLLELADREIIDVFIPILNNLAWKDDSKANHIEANLQLITHIKEKYRKPVIALCGYCTTSDAVRAFKNGCDDFFTLPFIPEDFVEAVERCLEMNSR
jgi:DNA-binding NtrC family response regulator